MTAFASAPTAIKLHIDQDEAVRHYRIIDFWIYEDGSGSCSDGVDNGADGVSEANDPDCKVGGLGTEDENASCSDGIDYGGGDSIDGADSDCKATDFDDIKAAHYGPVAGTHSAQVAHAAVYRYGLFAHQQRYGTPSSGKAEIWGNDFFVTLGSWSFSSGCALVGCQSDQQATFMHELGHNLRLRHGGSNNTNYRPNYLSIMNYLFQFNGKYASMPLDYSRWDLADLNEAALN